MSTDSLIANIDYNTKMDSNISLSLNSNEGTISPEDLSYAIIVNTSNEKIPVTNNIRKNSCLIIKLNILIISSIIILFCILYL